MNKVPEHKTKLAKLMQELHSALRRETKNIIEIGRLLLLAQKLVPYGEWLDWLDKNFALSYRSSRRYMISAEYVDDPRLATVANAVWENLSPSVLYALAELKYGLEGEAAILDAARGGRVDTERANQIWQDIETKAKAKAAEVRDKMMAETAAKMAAEVAATTAALEPPEDAEIDALLDGPPPQVPPPAPPPPTDFALEKFNKAIVALKEIRTKSAAHFASTIHSADDLRGVEDFVHAVTDEVQKRTG